MRIPRVVKARRFLRKMTGGSHAHLVEADDNACYVVKLANNPQGGRRTLINEMMASLLLNEAGIATPEAAYVAIEGEPGVHFGSRLPGIPGQLSVYDFLPDAMLPQLHNRKDFLGALAMDKWLSNGDSRQAIFYRGWIPDEAAVGWVAQMIDHGGIFQGSDWTFRNSPAQGVYAKRAVYGPNPSLRDFEPWRGAISDFRRSDLEQAVARLPAEWIEGEEPALQCVVDTLYARRGQTRALVAQSIDCFWGQTHRHSSVVLKFGASQKRYDLAEGVLCATNRD
jgi:hypothetical protein